MPLILSRAANAVQTSQVLLVDSEEHLTLPCEVDAGPFQDNVVYQVFDDPYTGISPATSDASRSLFYRRMVIVRQYRGSSTEYQ